MFSKEELLTPFIKSQIALEADTMAGKNAEIPDNISVSQWNNKQSADFRFYFTNFQSAIIEGLFPEIEEKIRLRYINKIAESNRTIVVEESFNLPDWQVPLDIYIERSCRAKNMLIKDHKQIVFNAITEGKQVPAEVLKDYSIETA